MSWIEVIDENEAEGDLKAAYNTLVDARGKAANIMRVQSLRPEVMMAHLELYLKVVLGRSGLRRPERELLATVVSAANGCAYCTHHHAEALRFYWKDAERVDAVVSDPAAARLDARERAMVAYAQKLTHTPDAMEEGDVDALRAAGFADRDVLDINLVASYFNFVNRIASGLGVTFTDDEAQGYRL